MGSRAPRKRVLILVEGDSDRGLLEELLKKLGVASYKIAKLDGNDIYKAARIAQAYEHKYNLIIVLKDQHNHTINEIEKQLNLLEKLLPTNTKKKLHTIIVRHAIEAWALADPEGLKRLCPDASFTGDPEQVPNPEEALRHELAKCNKTYLKTREWGRKLGRAIDPARAAQKSASLKQFLQTLNDP